MSARLAFALAAAIGAAAAGCADQRRDAGNPTGSATEAAGPREQPAARPSAGPVQVEMRNVHLHLGHGVMLKVHTLRGEMISTTRGEAPVFDNPRSYTLHVSEGDVAVDMASLTNLMNHYVFAGEDAPIENIRMSVEDGRLTQKGKLDKGIKIPFSVQASVAATPDGRLKLHAESMRAAGIPATKIMGLFGLSLDSLIDLERRGVALDDNDITIAIGEILPPPRLVGRVSHAAIVNGELRQTFAAAEGRRRPALAPDSGARNYVYFSGAVLRFGKLTMTGADLQLIDADERDPFDFSPEMYERQLVAGYSKTTADGGLHTFMPDYDDLSNAAKSKPRPRSRR